jgi:rare lipoprotein A
MNSTHFATVFCFFFSKKKFFLLLLVFSCTRPPPKPTIEAHPHYFLIKPYQINGHWYYPAETYSLDTTGIASVQPPSEGFTADGERRDPTLATAAMQTIQLPAIATVTDLENGRQIMLRVNDLGPASPARLIALSPRAAFLLAIPPGGAARVRVRIDEALSRRLVEQLGGNGQKLAIAPVARIPVREESLPPPGSSAPAGPARIIGDIPADAEAPRVPDRLPERVTKIYTDPGELYLRAGTFSRYKYAHSEAATLSGLGGDVLRSGFGRQASYTVRAGPFRSIAEADAALNQALRDGILDARITVE